MHDLARAISSRTPATPPLRLGTLGAPAEDGGHTWEKAPMAGVGWARTLAGLGGACTVPLWRKSPNPSCLTVAYKRELEEKLVLTVTAPARRNEQKTYGGPCTWGAPLLTPRCKAHSASAS